MSKINTVEESKSLRVKPNIKTGLSSREVEQKISNGQSNRIKVKDDNSYFKIIFRNTFTFFNILLVSIAALFVCFIGVTAIGNLSFLIIMIVNILIGTIQECKSKHTVSKLKLMTSPKVTVVRNSEEIQILNDDIVLDDIVKLSTGDQIPADCTVIDGYIEVNESMLTGESNSIKKNVNSFLYGGSFVSAGSCYAVVDRVGDNTYIASIEKKAKKFEKPKSKLINAITGIIKKLTIVIIPLGLLTFWHSFISSDQIKDGILAGGTTIVGMIPAGMVLLSSVAMAAGVLKLARKKTLVRELYSVESLARIDTLCLDKTGTLTDGSMTVEDVIIYDTTINLDKIMPIYLGAFESNNQTSDALIKRYGTTSNTSILNKIPFSSKRKFSAIELENGETYALGAPEFLTDDENILKLAEEKTKNGLRVVILMKLIGKIHEDEIPKRRKIIALFAIRDNIRPEVKSTMKWFAENDVEIRVISGDNINTVSYIAHKCGITNWDKAVSLDTVDERDIEQTILNNYIFGRVTPEQKALIVDVLHAHGRTVAITGDGVNDVLAMKKSDCSVALANGSPATKSIANVILLDSNFSNMPATVCEGRRVVNNIQRSSTLFLMKTFFVMFISLFCLLLELNMPIETSVMGIINTFITGISSFILSLEPSNAKINGSFTKNVLGKAIPAGFFMFMPILCVYIYAFVKCGINIDAVNALIQNKIPVIALLITISGFVIFYKVCKPFNSFRRILYIIILAICVFLVLSFPQFFLRNSTEFWGEMLAKYDYLGTLNAYVAVFKDCIKSIFSFELYKSFEAFDWIIICCFSVFSFIIYYISDIIISRMLKIKMFSDILNDEEK